MTRVRRETSRGRGPSPPATGVNREGRLALAGVIALLALPPFLVTIDAKEAFRLVKAMASGWLALASLLPLAWWMRRQAPSLRVAVTHPATIAIAPLALVVVAGAVTTSHPQHFREAFADFAIAVVALVGWAHGLGAATADDTRRAWRAVAIALAIVAGVMSLLLIDQAAGLVGLLSWLPIAATTDRLRLTATLGNPGDVAGFLVLPCLVACDGAARAAGGRRMAWSAAVVAMLVAIALTQTLVAVVAVAVGVSAWGWLMFPRARSLALATGALATLVLVLAVPGFTARVVEKVDQFRSGNVNAVLTGRLDGWRAAAWMAAQRPLQGVGHGAFRAEYAGAKLALLDRGVSFLDEQDHVMLATPHNEPLSIAAEQGLPGVVALLWAVVLLVRSAWGSGPDDRPRTIAALCALVPLSLASFPFHVSAIAWPWLVWMAFVFGAPGRGRPGASQVPRHAFLVATVAGVVVAGALAWQWTRWRDRIEAGRLLARVEARTMSALAARRAPSTLFGEHLAWLDAAARLDPLEVGVPIARGSQFLLLKRPDEAIAAYQVANALEPRPEIDLNLGRAFRLRGDAAAADAAFARARRLDARLVP